MAISIRNRSFLSLSDSIQTLDSKAKPPNLVASFLGHLVEKVFLEKQKFCVWAHTSSTISNSLLLAVKSYNLLPIRLKESVRQAAS